MITKVLSDNRILVEVTINGKKGIMLVDTGASLSIIDGSITREYNYRLGSKLSGTLTGISGNSDASVYHTKDLSIELQGIKLHQFVATDISAIKESIKQSTGYAINGIIGLPQIKSAELKIDADNGIIKIGY